VRYSAIVFVSNSTTTTVDVMNLKVEAELNVI